MVSISRPRYHSVYITCFTNKDEKGEVLFEFDDGGNNFNKGFYLKTDSIEVIINQLIEKGINNDPKKIHLVELNNYYE
jgi:hypothetical protein